MGYPHHNNTNDLLTLVDVSLDYGQFRALKNIHFSLGYAEIHAIVGEHGAGKSSLAMIISGYLKSQSGYMTFNEKEYRALTSKMSLKLGIEMVHQHVLSLNKYLTVDENISSFFLINAPLWKFPSKKKRLKAARSFLSQHHIEIDPSMPVNRLTVPDQVFVDILKHLYTKPRLLILDEALDKLTAAAFGKIVNILKQLKREGMSILLITHRIDDIYDLADRVSIIKNGEILLTDDVKNIDKLNLIKMVYTQISEGQNSDDNLNKQFYQLLKYNEAILQHLPVNLIITDNENHIKMVNEHCKHHFQLKKTSYLNVPLVHLFSSTNDEASKLIEHAFSFHEEKMFYQVPLTFNNIETISNIKTFPIYDGTFLIGNIIIIEDITEYDQLQKQLMLSEKLASLGLLAAGVAHEINNPLEIIYTYLSYMKYRFRTPEFHEAIDTVQEEVSSIANIVSNLRSFSDSNTTINEDIDLNDEIGTVLNLIKHNASYKHITIHFEPYEQDLVIRANKHEIKQVIVNLLKNSFEAMPSGGNIFIKTTQITENGSEFVQMTFKDTGPGIGDENPSNVFLPFYSTKKGQEGNLGLGLSVSYGIIKKYNGMILVQNLEDRAGCQFIITLPQSA
jgi:signal transduction histidine kinase/ABC-type branched-subunit amino acid transport system ATPase component